ncbi:MAG: GAF domain-containing protein [Anaerolinea sp.]|nr:GAF domain-containing protein [Anaerolinea sp.]MCC6974750.1 GAF domain-containing protein [Anaerolineae bacterium]CAG1006536.1 two-component system, OmpR family, sensor histidine kinase VicK [Anaerolineae bacterium]
MTSLSPMPQGTTRQYEMLIQITRLLSTLDLDQVLTTIIRLTTDTVGAAQGSFFLIDETGDKLQRFISAREIAPEKKAVVSSTILKGGLASWVIANRRAALVEDTVSDPRWMKLDDEAELKRVRSAICVPFWVENLIRGVMTLEHPAPNYFSEGDLELVEAAANQAANILRHAQLFDKVESQQRQLEAVLNSISEMLIVIDGEWRVRRINPEALSFIGVPAEHLIDRPLKNLAESGHPMFDHLYTQLREVSEAGEILKFEVRDEVSRRDFTVHAAPLDRSDPRQTGYVIALHDISSLKDLNRLKTHMIELATHDLKNPIGVVKGYLDVIKADAADGIAPDPSFLDNMYKAILRMESLVANLLDIQRAEHSSPLRRELIDPKTLVDQVLEDMQPSLVRMGHTLIRDIMSSMEPISGDHDRLREVMNNLVENAIKYTPPSGQITVKVYTEGKRFAFNVSDNGYGIPDDQKPFIFQPNFRVRQAGTEHIPGSGVGLSLVREMVERHGGQVWFTSKVGQGSTFGFWLPLLTE